MKFLTWDTGIIAALALLLAYSLLIRKHKSLATLVCVYVGYAMALLWGQRIVEFFNGDRVFLNQVWIKANASSFIVQSLLMILIIFLLSSFIKLGGRRSRYSTVEVVAYAVATLALTVSFMTTFMEPGMLESVMASSRIVPYLYEWREWISVLPVVIIIFFGIYANDDQ